MLGARCSVLATHRLLLCYASLRLLTADATLQGRSLVYALKKAENLVSVDLSGNALYDMSVDAVCEVEKRSIAYRIPALNSLSNPCCSHLK